jgi:hypothetical protein
MGDRTSRDANDPRDELRAMNKQARSEMENDEMGQTGGQERRQRVADRMPERGVENARRDLGNARREPDASGKQRVPRGEEGGADTTERGSTPRGGDR